MQQTTALYQKLLSEYQAGSRNVKTETRLAIGETGVLITKQGDRITFGSKAYDLTARGSLIQINDTDEAPLAGLRIFGKTTQNGTPTPDAPVELESVGDGGSVGVTVCGKNLFSATWEHGGINPNTGIDYASGDSIRCGYIAVCPLTTYALSRTISTSFMNVRGYDADKNFIGSGDIAIELVSGSSVANPMGAGRNACVIKTKENVHYLRFGDASNDLSTLYQLEIGSTATAYEPYDGKTLTLSTPNGLPALPVTSGGNYTDENGQQWICDEVDFGRGVYVQRVGKIVNDGSKTGATSVLGNYTRTYFAVKANAGGSTPKAMSDFLPYLVNYTKESEHFYIANNGDLFCFVKSSRLTSSDFAGAKAYFASNPLTVLYVLGDAIETDLTAEELAAYAALHTNYQNTTVFNDGGADMEVVYTMNGDGPTGVLTGTGGAEAGYDETLLISMETDRRVFSEDSPTVGACISGQIDIRMLKPFGEIPTRARMVPYVRLTDGSRFSEWIQKGVFYIDTRGKAEDGSDIEKIQIHGYDDMLKAEQDYPASTLAWPARDIDVVREIAAFIGVAIDPRTIPIINRGYTIQYPAGYSCRDVLGYIAAMYAGCFVMSDIGELRLVTIYGIPKETRYLIDRNGQAITFGGVKILV